MIDRSQKLTVKIANATGAYFAASSEAVMKEVHWDLSPNRAWDWSGGQVCLVNRAVIPDSRVGPGAGMVEVEGRSFTKRRC